MWDVSVGARNSSSCSFGKGVFAGRTTGEPGQNISISNISLGIPSSTHRHVTEARRNSSVTHHNMQNHTSHCLACDWKRCDRRAFRPEMLDSSILGFASPHEEKTAPDGSPANRATDKATSAMAAPGTPRAKVEISHRLCSPDARAVNNSYSQELGCQKLRFASFVVVEPCPSFGVLTCLPLPLDSAT